MSSSNFLVTNASNASSVNVFANISAQLTSLFGAQAIRAPQLAQSNGSIISLNGIGPLPTLKSVNVIVPDLLQISNAITIQQPDQAASLTSQKFTSYASNTGLMSNRPEVISVCDFEPLYDVNGDETTALEYYQATRSLRRTRSLATGSLVSSFYQRYSSVKSAIDTAKVNFSASVGTVNGLMQTVYSVLSTASNLEAMLDLRSHVVKSNVIVNNYVLSEIKPNQWSGSSINPSSQTVETMNQFTGQEAASLTSYMLCFLPQQYDYADVLANFGFTANNIQLFAPTKLWTQTLYELKQVLLTHSPQLLSYSSRTQSNDSDPIALTRAGDTKFSFTNAQLNLPKLSNIMFQETAADAQNLIHLVNQTWSGLYTNITQLGNNERIIALCNLLTKEFRYSRGLADPQTQATLQNNFNYTVNAQGNNLVLFDSVIGVFGKDCFDVSNDQNKLNTFLSLSQTVIGGQYDVLTFESEYVTGTDNGTLSPSGPYYVQDAIDTLNTTRIATLSSKFKSSLTALNSLVDKMNWLDYDVANSTTTNTSGSMLGNTSFMQNPWKFYYSLYASFMSNQGSLVDAYKNGDPMLALLSLAMGDDGLKTLLFLYVVKMNFLNPPGQVNIGPIYVNGTLVSSGSSANTQSSVLNYASTQLILDHLINRFDIVMRAFAYTTTSSGKNSKSLDYSKSSIVAALKSNSGALKTAGTLLYNTMSQFINDGIGFSAANNTAAMNDGVTRYSGYIDTSIAMAVFDTILSVVKDFCGHSFVSVQYHSNVDSTYTMSVSNYSTQYVNSVLGESSDISTRLRAEMNKTQMTVFALMNSLMLISNSIDNFVAHLSNGTTQASLSQVNSEIGNSTVSLLTKETQALMLISHARDVSTLINNVSNTPSFHNEIQNPQYTQLDSVLCTLMQNEHFASDSKVLTVGMPIGSLGDLWSSASVTSLKKTIFSRKERDLVYLSVYMMDTANTDMVFLPTRFLFEVTRFPIRYDVQGHLQSSSPRDCYNAVASREMRTELEFKPAINDQLDVIAFASDEYQFLSDVQKQQLYANHSLSFLLERYLNVMTGMRLDEISFMSPQAHLALDKNVDANLKSAVMVAQVSSASQSTASQRQGVLFNTTPSVKQSQVKAVSAPAVPVAVSSLSQEAADKMLNNYGLVDLLNRVLNLYSDSKSAKDYLLRPRTFDRIFNVIVSRSQFEVDVAGTNETPLGQSQYANALANGILYVDASGSVKVDSKADARLYKYIVTIETFDEVKK